MKPVAPKRELSDDYVEKLELVAQAYERTLNLETAFTLVPMSDEVRERLKADPELLALLEVYKARKFETIISGIEDIINDVGEKNSVKLSAMKELGRILLPDKFKEKSEVEMSLTYKVIPRRRA
jgi:hypothetical protein